MILFNIFLGLLEIKIMDFGGAFQLKSEDYQSLVCYVCNCAYLETAFNEVIGSQSEENLQINRFQELFLMLYNIISAQIVFISLKRKNGQLNFSLMTWKIFNL